MMKNGPTAAGICLRQAGFLVLALLTATVSAQPPPPPPPGMPDYGTVPDRLYNLQDMAGYGRLFRQDVRVFVDGQPVATDREGYLRLIRAEFDRNLHVRTLAWAQGSQILAMQRVDGCVPVHPVPTAVYHDCPAARAVRYDLGEDNIIAEVHILPAEQAWNMHPPLP